MKRYLLGCIIALLLLLLAACSPAAPLPHTLTPQQTKTPTFEPIQTNGLIENVVFAENFSKQSMTLQLPKERDLTAPVLFIQSGKYFPELVAYISGRGYSVISVSVQNYTFQHEMEDSFYAMGFIHAEAETFGLDPDRIMLGSLGTSKLLF